MTKSRRLAATTALAAGLFLCPAVAHADPVATPAFAGPLTPNPEPLTIDAGPFGEVTVTGQLTGIGAVQSNATRAGGIGNEPAFADVSNAMVELQTIGGPLQFYVQGGLYSFPTVGTAYTQATDATDLLYGAIPLAYAKAVLTPQLSISGGYLPTLIGAEGGFTFQNFNIQRGMLWNQEPVVSRGVQVNYASGPVSIALSFNDGYFSGKLNWVSGLFSYAFDSSNSLAITGGAALSASDQAGPATPLAQNNSSIVSIIYTHTSGRLQLIPYVQYSHVGRDQALGLETSAETWSAALLAKYQFDDNWSLGARVEYIDASAGACAVAGCTPTNLLYGPDSSAWSLTATPTFQTGRFFVRGEVSYARISDFDPGLGFGRNFDERDQVRGMIETGFLF